MLNPTRIASRAAGACALALAFMAPVHAAPVLEMSAATSATGLDLTVSTRDVVGLSLFQFTLNFDPTLLAAVGSTEGSFLSNVGSTFFIPGTIDNTAGSISYVINTLFGTDAADGAGDLVSFSFDVAQAGLASFSFSDVMFLNAAGDEIVVDARGFDTQVAAVPEPASLWLTAIGLCALLGGRAMRPRTR